MSMQMDACLKKEQIGTLFVRVGALEGGVGGGEGGLRGVHPKKYTCRPKKKPSATSIKSCSQAWMPELTQETAG
jgi:hypothetical protein